MADNSQDQPEAQQAKGEEAEKTSRDNEGQKKKSEKKEKKSDRSSDRSKKAGESTDSRAKQREYVREELRRLEENLHREASKIHKPKPKKHTPFIFNTLEPYYNTYTVKYLVEGQVEKEEFPPHGSVSRSTAIGLIDPWENLRMDRSPLPPLDQRSPRRAHTDLSREPSMLSREHSNVKDKKKKKRDKSAEKLRKEGSTRLPKFPMVALDTKDMTARQLYYSDVPHLRQELKSKVGLTSQRKVDADYTRTKQDFYRMELDRLSDIHPINRPHMRSAYFAYLQNTPGSKKAISECLKTPGRVEGKAN